jgi:nitric oxide reductase NorQ protein
MASGTTVGTTGGRTGGAAIEQRSGEYHPVADELDLVLGAWRAQLPVLLKGPTGCGKTKLVEHLAEHLDLPLVTVSCHEDMLTADLVGRFLLEGGDTVWQDGPLTRAVRQGGICYLDEIVEARSDATVAIHSLADHRRQLFVERRDELLTAPPGFMLVISYNPGYQNLLKDLKPSTRQRFVAVQMGFPPPEVEARVVAEQSGAGADTVQALVRLAQAVRGLTEPGLTEVVSTRALIAAARLTVAGIPLRRAASSAISAGLTDDPELTRALDELVDSYLG